MIKQESKYVDPLLVDILVELTQIRLALTTDLCAHDISGATVQIISSKNYLTDIIKEIKVKELNQ